MSEKKGNAQGGKPSIERKSGRVIGNTRRDEPQIFAPVGPAPKKPRETGQGGQSQPPKKQD